MNYRKMASTFYVTQFEIANLNRAYTVSQS